MKKVLMAVFLFFTFLIGLWKLLIGCKHGRLISHISELPPKKRYRHSKLFAVQAISAARFSSSKSAAVSSGCESAAMSPEGCVMSAA